MSKKYYFLGILLISFLVIVSCAKKTSSAEPTTKFNIAYSGFITVNDAKVSDYAMTDYYLITNENDWKTWSTKYINSFPYYLENIDWNKECLIVYAYSGAKDSWNTISSIKNILFDNNSVDIIFDDKIPKIYAFNSNGTKHIALFVIKLDRPTNLSSIDSRYLTYTTTSPAN